MQRISPRRLVVITAMLAIFATAPSGAARASDGSIGATSRGTVQISVSVAPRMTVSRDMLAARPTGGSNAAEEHLCLSSNGPGSYSVRISGEAGGAGAGPGSGRSFSFPSGLSATDPDRTGRGVCSVASQRIALPADPAGARASLLLLIAPD